MKIYHVIKGAFGGSDLFDSNWNQIGYSLPSLIGKGEDFYDMNGNELGQSYESAFGGEDFTGSTGSYGFFDEEILNVRNLYLHGKLTESKDTMADTTSQFPEYKNSNLDYDNSEHNDNWMFPDNDDDIGNTDNDIDYPDFGDSDYI